MTWIPCNRCLSAPCVCSRDVVAAPQFYQVPVVSMPLHLSDEDIERLAKRVEALLSEQLTKLAEELERSEKR